MTVNYEKLIFAVIIITLILLAAGGIAAVKELFTKRLKSDE